jgi:hypothetical protein
MLYLIHQSEGVTTMTKEQAQELIKMYIQVLTLEQQVKALEEKLENIVKK